MIIASWNVDSIRARETASRLAPFLTPLSPGSRALSLIVHASWPLISMVSAREQSK